jgi:hypothetical protein
LAVMGLGGEEHSRVQVVGDWPPLQWYSHSTDTVASNF